MTGSTNQLIDSIRAAMLAAKAGSGDAEPDAGENWRSPQAAAIEETYDTWFPAIAPKVFSHSFEWFHWLFLDWYWPLLKLRAAGEAVPADIPLASLLCLGRGLGKSAILEGVALAEGAHFGRAFGLYVSSTRDKTTEHLQNVRALIESSEVARYYPGLAQPQIGKFGNQRGWRGDALYTKCGFTLVGASLEQGVRGLRDVELRPGFVEIDDIDERDDSLNIKQEKFETLSRDIIPMLAPYGLVIFTQNLIYSGSVMDDTINARLDWMHLAHKVGPINTFKDDLEIEKVDGRPTIVAGTPNWRRINLEVAQDILNKAGEESFMIECQNKTAPSVEKLVWKGFDEQLHVISRAQFKAIFNSEYIPAGWNLYGGYDAGASGPDRHPAVFSVAAVADSRGPLSGDIFIFYEFVAEAIESEDDMAKGLILDLATLCAHPKIREAASLVRASYSPYAIEAEAIAQRRRAGALIPFKMFRGSHEAKSERRTFQQKWGLPIIAGNSAKTAGLPELRHHLKPERRPHPFKPGVMGKPNIFMVVADDQLHAAKNRFGLARHRWEAANLKNDPNVTTRDVPEKFGDDATDAVKHILQNFVATAAPKSVNEQVQQQLPETWREEHLRTLSPQERQRYQDFADEEARDVRERLENRRRPRTWDSALTEDVAGDAGDIY